MTYEKRMANEANSKKLQEHRQPSQTTITFNNCFVHLQKMNTIFASRFNAIHFQTDKNGYAFWCAPVGFLFCTVRLSVMLESSVARVDETHSYFVTISCVTLMTRYQMAMLTTQVLIMSYKR